MLTDALELIATAAAILLAAVVVAHTLGIL